MVGGCCCWGLGELGKGMEWGRGEMGMGEGGGVSIRILVPPFVICESCELSLRDLGGRLLPTRRKLREEESFHSLCKQPVPPSCF